jgi:hypothetical protein
MTAYEKILRMSQDEGRQRRINLAVELHRATEIFKARQAEQRLERGLIALRNCAATAST